MLESQLATPQQDEHAHEHNAIPTPVTDLTDEAAASSVAASSRGPSTSATSPPVLEPENGLRDSLSGIGSMLGSVATPTNQISELMQAEL